MKKIISLVLAIVLCMSLSVTALAAETDIPADVEKNTIEITLEPGESIDESDVTPYIWGQETHDVPYDARATAAFNIPDRNFAFEMKGTGINNEPINGTYTVELNRGATIKASRPGNLDGTTYKVDWISVEPGNYYFTIYNYTSVTIKVVLTYYSWA